MSDIPGRVPQLQTTYAPDQVRTVLTLEQRMWLYRRQLEVFEKTKAGIEAAKLDGDEVIFVMGKDKKEVKVPLFNFRTMKKAWELMGVASRATDTVERVSAVLQILEIALERSKDPLTAAKMEDLLLPQDFDKLTGSYGRLLVESNLLTLDDMKPVEPDMGENQGGGGSSTSSSNGSGQQTNGTDQETKLNSLPGPTSIQ